MEVVRLSEPGMGWVPTNHVGFLELLGMSIWTVENPQLFGYIQSFGFWW